MVKVIAVRSHRLRLQKGSSGFSHSPAIAGVLTADVFGGQGFKLLDDYWLLSQSVIAE